MTMFILEIANNHMGSVSTGLDIVHQFHNITKNFPQFSFAFKFQRRNLDKLIHKDFKNRTDIKLIKRFTETQLSLEELNILKKAASSLGFVTICTPFDEQSVTDIVGLDFNYIKIASCCVNDWPILNKVAEYKKPVIVSVGGASSSQIEDMVTFFGNRNVEIACIMHCVAIYPTDVEDLNIGHISFLRNKYKNIAIGFSSHERPDSLDGVKMAIVQGAKVFERHVSVNYVNDYSLNPQQFEKYLQAADDAVCMTNSDVETRDKEKVSISSLKRGAYLRNSVKAGKEVTRNDLYFAIPLQCNELQVSVDDCSKYTSFKMIKDCNADEPLTHANASVVNNRGYIQNITNSVVAMLNSYGVAYPKHSKLEISHHYGLEHFYNTGLAMITLINGKYCKKLLVILPGQTCPRHVHQVKDETFFILGGEVEITIDGEYGYYNRGDMINVPPKTVHGLSSAHGAVIEEISSTHNASDSTYIDHEINQNTNRKTVVYLP